jgi:PAS domain-containing protein
MDAILATLPEAVAIIRLDHRLADINPAGLELLGVTSFDDVPQDTPLSLIAPVHTLFPVSTNGTDYNGAAN